MRKSFQSFEKFGRKYKPQKQAIFALNEKKTIMGDYSTLETLDVAYGPGSAASWIVVHLADLNTFIGAKNMTDEQTKDLAKIIYSEYKNLKFSVMMLFFFKFKTGAFGKFYGMVDPMVITCALKDFASSCEAKRQEYLNEEYEKEHQYDLEHRKMIRSRWFDCQHALCSAATSVEMRQIFAGIVYDHFDERENTLLLQVTRADHALLEGDYCTVFFAVLSRFYPGVRLNYRIIRRGSEITAGFPAKPFSQAPTSYVNQ